MSESINNRKPLTDRWSISYTGRKVGPAYLSPTLTDISVCLGRICRYAGNCQRFWPVLLHSFVVADLLPDELKVYGLLHDATESVMSDIPRGFKPVEFSEVEDQLFNRILAHFSLPTLTDDQAKLVKLADDEALSAEIWTIGPPKLRDYITARSAYAESLVLEYATAFPPNECIVPGGLAVIEFQHRVNDALVHRKQALEEMAVAK